MTPDLPVAVQCLLEHVHYDQSARAALRGYALATTDRKLAGWIRTFLAGLPPVVEP